MKIIKRSHGAKNIEQLEKQTIKKINKFNKDFNSTNTDKSYIDYKILTNNILIKCDHVKADGVEFKHTEVYNIKEKTVICVSGISTLNIYDIPMKKELYNYNN